MHPRLLLREFLSLDLCKELEFIHRSCCTIGYRPNVFSTTLFHLIAANCAHLLVPLVPIRESLKDKVEEHFGCQFELFVEFTGLISWSTGSSIGWHSDDNRPYLKQRDFAVVCYLNDSGSDFKGGIFRFQDGEPTTIMPMAGDVLMYTADSKNIHCVEEITEGERITLTLWFTRDRSHDEDTKLISHLSESLLGGSFFPVLPSNHMCWFPPGTSDFESGFDIRLARLHALQFELYSCQQKNHLLNEDAIYKSLELLMEPVQVACGSELLGNEFANVLHLLQVVYFYYWKVSKCITEETQYSDVKVTPISTTQREEINSLKDVLVRDPKLAKTMFRDLTCGMDVRYSFNWISFVNAVSDWEKYISKLREELLTSLPHWTAHKSIFAN